MNLQKLSDTELHACTIRAADAERLATTTLLHHLNEVQRRKLYAHYSCASLFDYCVRVLSMSEPQAARRVNAARLLEECPEIESKINQGTLSLTVVSQAQVFFRRERSVGVELNASEKMELIARLEAKPTREVERILVKYSSDPAAASREMVRIVSPEITELKVGLDVETLANLNSLKELWSHQLPNATYAQVIKVAAEKCVRESDPLRKLRNAKVKKSRVNDSTPSIPRALPTPAPESRARKTRSRYIPASIKRAVWSRDRGSCRFVGVNGERCGSKHFLQIDHIQPFALEGESSTDNLQLLCFTHNQMRAKQEFARLLKQ